MENSSPEPRQISASTAAVEQASGAVADQNAVGPKDQQNHDASDSKLAGLLGLVADGFRIFPLHYPVFTDGEPARCSCGKAHDKEKDIGKHPRIAKWQDAATRDHGQIREWHAKWPEANWAIATGEFVVIDEDAPGAAAALGAVLPGGTLPATRRVITGRGRHTYYRHRGASIKNSAGALAAALDVRGDGGYVVAPGSIHATGAVYRWEDAAVEIAPLPEELAQALGGTDDAPDQSLGDEGGEIDPATMGEGAGRNDYLTRLAGRLRRAGHDREVIADELLEANARFAIPLDEGEVRTIAKSVARYAVADHLTDLGNAQRLVARHGVDLRYATAWKCWLIWDGRRWAKDQTAEIERLVKDTVVAFGKAAVARTDLGKDDRKRAVAWALTSESGTRLREAERVARSEEGMPIKIDALDVDPWVLNLRNGTLDLRTGELRTHDKRDLLTKLAPVSYEPAATAPKWERFVTEAMADDHEMVRFLQHFTGYCLTGIASEQVFILHHGDGDNGKSQFIEAVRGLLGEDYAAQTDFATVIARREQGIRNDLARLKGTRFVAATEGEEGQRLSESVVKRLTGDDTIAARFLFQEFFEFKPTFKLSLATNHRPVIRGTDNGIWRRVLLVPWTVVVPPSKRVKDYANVLLREEASGILNWALAGCRAWQEHGLMIPATVHAETQKYRTESDEVVRFIEERCESGEKLSAEASALYGRFCAWSHKSREDQITQTEFGRRLDRLGYAKERRGSGNHRPWYRLGLRLLAEVDF